MFRGITAELIVSKELSDLIQTEDGYSTEGFVRLVGTTIVKGFSIITLTSFNMLRLFRHFGTCGVYPGIERGRQFRQYN